MLGQSLPNGSEAISFQNTLFRVSELCWVKAVRLTTPELVVRVLALVLGLAWIFLMKSTKGTFTNLEFLLAIFPLILAWNTSGSLKIGCSGDFEEAYERRGGLQPSLFQGWIKSLRNNEPSWLHMQSSNYDLIMNPNRVAWARPCFQWRVFPLIVAVVFFAYLRILAQGWDFEAYPVLDEFQVLIFESGQGMVKLVAWAIILTAIAAFALSVKRSVEVCGTGGVQDVFPLSASDQSLFLGVLAGTRNARSGSSAPAKRQVVVAAPEVVEAAAPVTSVVTDSPEAIDDSIS